LRLTVPPRLSSLRRDASPTDTCLLQASADPPPPLYRTRPLFPFFNSNPSKFKGEAMGSL
jgi:hypothetical protein